jgi:DNA-binding MarR family transcriptional regulator
MTAPQRLSDPLFVMIGELLVANGRLKRIFAEATAETGLTQMAYQSFIVISDGAAPTTVPALGRRLGHPRQVMQRAVNELIAAGLIETLPNPQHKRIRLLRPTDHGKSFKQASDDRVIATARALLKHVDNDRCRRIARELGGLRQEIDAYLRQTTAAESGRTSRSSRSRRAD